MEFAFQPNIFGEVSVQMVNTYFYFTLIFGINIFMFTFFFNVFCQIEELHVRMRALLAVILGEHNELRDMVQSRAAARWDSLLPA